MSAIANLPGYQLTEQLYTGTRTLVYRGVRTCDQQPVVIKLLRNEYPNFNELVQFRNQYTIAKNLDFPGIIKPLTLETYGNGYALVTEDFGEVSLSDYLKTLPQELPLTEFLDIAIQLTESLHYLYQNRVIHKDIKPANILINPTTKHVKLIDFSISSLLPRETQEIQNLNVLEGTLAYISPEQTGRMNRGIDYRTDFYSLGVTFYELLTGKLPFECDEPMELVHCHIAKTPPMLAGRKTKIPPIVSKIVIRLMAKNAEDRYQSALGIKYDLEKCLHQWQATGRIENFKLGEHDISDRFTIPEKLYGRETEVHHLLNAFDRVTNGTTEMMLVAGFSGVGKTAVVNEVHKPITRQKGYFIKGKYDQFNRNIPLSAFVQALRELMGQLLSESDTGIADWKTKILSALGDNGQVLIEVIPELERIIGQQPPAPELSGTAAQNRFNILFQKFIAVFTNSEHPLVLFLDDLQWADSASLQFVKLLMEEQNYLLLLGAYRDNEVSPAHPLMLTLEELKKSGKTVNTITLKPLAFNDTNQLVAETLLCPGERSRPLTELIERKTQGNPFFITQFLKALHEDGQITFNRDCGYWECDLTQINVRSLTEDVVEFMAIQLQKLPKETQEILKLAACIGNTFDLKTLAIVCERSATDVAVTLWKALQEGLILPQSQVYKFYVNSDEIDLNSDQKKGLILKENDQETFPSFGVPAFQGAANPKSKIQNPKSTDRIENIAYRFLHDRVQQAAYSLIPEEQKQTTHLKIGRLLLLNTPESEWEEIIFVLALHLNIASDLITASDEKATLSQLNFIAGRKAKSSTAYEAAIRYLESSLKLLSDESWSCQYELTLQLFEQIAEAAYLCGNFQKMEKSLDQILTHARTFLDKIQAYEILIGGLTAQDKAIEALETGIGILKHLGISIPLKPSENDISESFGKSKILWEDKNPLSLINLPLIDGATQFAATKILTALMPPAYFTDAALFCLFVFEAVQIGLQYGHANTLPFPYACYGFLLIEMEGKIEQGYRFGKLAIEVAEKLNDKEAMGRAIEVLYGHIQHWKAPLTDSLNFLLQGYQSSLDAGDLEYAAYNSLMYCYHAYFAGYELSSVEQDMKRYGEVIQRFNHAKAVYWHNIYHQAVLNLLSLSPDAECLSGHIYNELESLPLHLKANDFGSLGTLYLNKVLLCYLLKSPEEAIIFSDKAEQYLGGLVGQFGLSILALYDALIRLALISNCSEIQQQVYRDKIDKNHNKLRDWAQTAPTNFQHKVDLIEAEKQRVLGHKAEAIDYYDRAISGAKQNHYIQEEALANELAAKFYLNWGKEKIAATYMQEAYYCYSQWGAKAKVTHLEKCYPHLLKPILQQPRMADCWKGTVMRGTIASSRTSSSTSEALDLATLLQASQAISGEIELDKLLTTLLNIVIANAGADRCVLLLKEDHSLNVVALAEAQHSPQLQLSIPLELSQDVPISLVNTVKRTLKPVILPDARINSQFTADQYLQKYQPKSVFCSPILNQGQLIGILYLENNLAVAAFTSDRVAILNLICAQAAISLENARLYQAAKQALTDLKHAQLQIVQSEKMSALGNLVAGVAHEINNPVGFLKGNIQPTLDYIQDLFRLIDLYQGKYPDPDWDIQKAVETIELDYIREDLPKLVASMQEGIKRIQDISASLRTFSRADSDRPVACNIHEGLNSTLMILKHRLKAKEHRPEIQVIKNYGNLCPIKCYAGQLNQVFMNILSNAIDALEEGNQGRSYQQIHSQILVQTELSNDKRQVIIRIKDNGIGMSEDVKKKIFDHLFTTKGVGKGTGLGLAIARQIIEEKHQGSIQVNSEIGIGTEFIISLPIKF